jgi:DnaJ-class molecular chaperone
VSIFDATETCDRCAGQGYEPLFFHLFRLCRPCEGTGETVKTSRRIWRLMRHGLAPQEDGGY